MILAAGANTSHLAAQVGIYTPPMLAHHVRFTFPAGGGRRAVAITSKDLTEYRAAAIRSLRRLGHEV